VRNPLSKTAKSVSRRRLPALLGALACLALAGGLTTAVGKPAVATPTITSAPASFTNQTSATFAFKANGGVTFQCSLDAAAFVACASPKAYAGLAAGTHTFQVRARSSAGELSSPASHTWTIDRVAPVPTISAPADGAAYNATSWAAACPAGSGLCGAASDPSGIAAVQVSIRQQATGRYWNGKGFTATSETLLAASGTTSWRYALSLPSDGGYVVHARATDVAGNTTAAASQASATFAIDTKAPVKPQITQSPARATSATSATFAFVDGEAGVGFQCQLDGAAWESCASPATYTGLAAGQHSFGVRAVDQAGNRSAATTYAWTVVEAGGQPFTIGGGAVGSLYPGVTRTLALTIANPNSVAISVTSIVVAIAPGSTHAGCDGPANLELTQSDVSAANPLTVPANGQVTLPAGTVTAPGLRMRNLATNQDACKGAVFSLTYSGSAHS
jgi:hypothetical protein